VSANRLVVVIPDELSTLIAKGEVTERYYNPGDLFREVHIVMTNGDRPSAPSVQPMVGSAQLYLHNIGIDDSLFRRTLGWRPRLLRPWARRFVELVRELRPQLIRCHGAHLNAFAASEARRLLGVPYVISMHGNPDADLRHHWKGNEGDRRFRVALHAQVAFERVAIANAACVVCVYRFIEPYAHRMGARRVEVIYNVVNDRNLREKDDYSLSDPPRIIVPGRQVVRKDPRPVVEALAALPEVRCTFVGRGPLHQPLVELARQLGMAARCTFSESLSNDELCSTLREHDAVISVNDYGGVSKVELEAALTGMPIITNAHPQEEAPEILGDACVTVSGDAASYRGALRRLLGDEELRARLGEEVRRNAEAAEPGLMEQKYVDLYREVLAGGRDVAAALAT
jgi:glycosyltransferase involved in cell wall biosynthesis